jgi:hypothetical protein
MPSTRRLPAGDEPPRTADAPAADEPAGLRASLRDGGRFLLLLLGLALALKLVVALASLDTNPLAQRPASDALYYLERARGLAGLVDDPLADEPHHLPPLYPRVLRLVPGAVHGELLGVLALQALAGTSLLAGTWLLARRRLPRPAALLAVVLTLLYGPLTFYETRLLGDSLATALLVLLLVACDALHDASRARGRTLAGLLAGLSLALAALLPPQALLLLPLLAAWAARRCRRAAAALLLAALLPLLPSTLHNLRAGAGLAPVSDNGAVNLWIAGTGEPSGTFQAPGLAFGDIATQARAARELAQARSGQPLDPSQVSDWFVHEALGGIAADPLAWLTRVGQRARALLESFETDVAAFPPVEMGLVPPLAPLALPFGLLLALAAGALALGGRLRPAPCLPALALAGMVVLTALAFFHYSRFRLPLAPLLALLAASAWAPLAARTARPARTALALVLATALVWQSYRPAAHWNATRANGWASVGWARLSQVVPQDAAAAEQVLADAERALALQPGFPRAERLAARACLLLHRFADAGRHLDTALAAAPGYDEAALDLALLQAIDEPANPRHDPAAARALLPRLQALARRSPALAESVAQVEALLERTSPPR